MIYGKERNGKIVDRREAGKAYPSREPLIVNGVKLTTPNTTQQFVDAGWLLETLPVVTPTIVRQCLAAKP